MSRTTKKGDKVCHNKSAAADVDDVICGGILFGCLIGRGNIIVGRRIERMKGQSTLCKLFCRHGPLYGGLGEVDGIGIRD